MAKRKYSRMKKIEPSIQSIFIPATALTNVPHTGSPRTSFYIDLSQIASLINRRFYRQGINWAVSGIKIATGMTSGSIEVNKLPNTWVMSNSWEKGFRAWQKMNKEATSEAPSIRPKFLDFKIYADAEHHQKGFVQNLLPSAGTPSALSLAAPGEWIASKFEVPAAVNVSSQGANSREIIAVGNNYPGASPVTGLDAVSLIEGYASSRGLPDIQDPNTPRDATDAAGTNPENWMTALFNEGSEQDAQVLDVMTAENDQAPYPFENGENPLAPGTTFTDTMYPGGANQMPGLQMHDFAYWTNTAQTVVNIHHIKGGNFPCGLIKLNVQNTGDVDASFGMIIDLVPGNHRGYLCEPMTEM